MLALRFANGIFEPIWNRQFIDHVQITVAESIGIEGRAGYYEQAGAIRDIFQNHLLQLLALTAMEPPIDFTADVGAEREGEGAARAAHARAEVGRARASTAAATSRARRCRVPRGGRRRAATRSPTPTSPRSSTSTTGAGPTRRSTCARASGSRAARRRSRSSSSARRTRRSRRSAADGLRPNVLLSTSSRTRASRSRSARRCPGAGMTIRTVHMDFLYGGAFRDGLPEAYERLILDAMLGDATLFTRDGRGRGAVGARRRDRRRVAARPAGVPELRGRQLGAADAPTSSSTATAARGGGTELGARRRGDRALDREIDARSSRGCASRRRTTSPSCARA